MDKVAPAVVAGFRALVVDDEAALADVVASYLKRESFETSVAHDGDSALTLAREVDPDVVILDIGLPGVDGIEVCRQLRVFSDAYVIMLTEIPSWTPSSGCLSARTITSRNHSAPANSWPVSGRCCDGPAAPAHLTWIPTSR